MQNVLGVGILRHTWIHDVLGEGILWHTWIQDVLGVDILRLECRMFRCRYT